MTVEYDGMSPSAVSREEAQAQSDAGFRADLETLVNRYSRENGSDTPDFILADYLLAALKAFDHTVRNREAWYGRRTGVAVLSAQETKR